MLILKRRRHQIIDIGDCISICVVGVDHENVDIGIKAPKHILINRREVTRQRQCKTKRQHQSVLLFEGEQSYE